MIRPAHLQKLMGQELDAPARDEKRAALIRERLRLRVKRVVEALDCIESTSRIEYTKGTVEPMFGRFTERAQKVVVLSQEEARRLGHNVVGTEHILLGLAAEGEGVAARALQNMDISLEKVRSEVEKVIGRGDGTPARADRLHAHGQSGCWSSPLTRRASWATPTSARSTSSSV